ncbi:hypothetical protein R1flu_020834 [Riccia fluitans]|uniref:Uncharacterized protein n=1 Tax=Riccia fluitans TaxID=41844 RepID=A0ABD1ZP86_9MARC
MKSPCLSGFTQGNFVTRHFWSALESGSERKADEYGTQFPKGAKSVRIFSTVERGENLETGERSWFANSSRVRCLVLFGDEDKVEKRKEREAQRGEEQEGASAFKESGEEVPGSLTGHLERKDDFFGIEAKQSDSILSSGSDGVASADVADQCADWRSVSKGEDLVYLSRFSARGGP